jgi:membrane protein involved in colicin uptake
VQVQREQAAARQERALLAEQRSQREAEQEALAARLAAERAAAAERQSSAERAVDAARGAELEAAKAVADLKGQVRPLGAARFWGGGQPFNHQRCCIDRESGGQTHPVPG